MLGPCRSLHQQGVPSIFGVLLYSEDGAVEAPGPSHPLRAVRREWGNAEDTSGQGAPCNE